MSVLDRVSTNVAQLTPEESEQLLTCATDCARTFGSPNAAGFAPRAAAVAQSLPSSLRAKIVPFRANHRHVALAVRGIPVADEGLGATPASWRQADSPDAARFGFMAALLGSLLGECIAWRSQQDGRLVTDVLPTQGMERSLVSSSSTLELGWHTEDAFSEARADFVGLLALRDPEAAATTVASVDTGALDEETVRTLFEARFVTRPDDAHEAGASQELAPSPILSGDGRHPHLRIDRDFTAVLDPDDAGAERALRRLIAHIDSRMSEAPMRSGEMTFIDNRRAVHGRRPFRPRYDGTDRWFKRVNVVLDLGRTEGHRLDLDSRVI